MARSRQDSAAVASAGARPSSAPVADGVARATATTRSQRLALRMYIQLQDAFGWDAFETVFAEYRDLPADQRPRNDNQKRDQWLVRMSRTTGRNLGPFFTAWGVPTTEAARESITDLPEWMPPGWD